MHRGARALARLGLRLAVGLAAAAVVLTVAAFPAAAKSAPTTQPKSPPTGPVPTADEQLLRLHDRTRLAYSQTAQTRPPGELAWSTYNLGIHELSFGLTNNVQLGVTGIVPVMVYGVGPSVKAGWSLSDSVSVAVTGSGFLFGLMRSDVRVWAGSGGPVLTWADGRLSATLGGGMFGFRAEADDENGGLWGGYINAGLSVVISRRILFNLESVTPLLNKGSDEDDQVFEFSLLTYGLRLTGDHVYGGINFVVPLASGVGRILKYAPFGFPLLTLGYNFR